MKGLQQLETSRGAEVFTEEGLTSRTTTSMNRMHSYLVKELLDNALDSAEGSKNPEVEVSILEKDDKTSLTISDNGEGMTREELENVLDLDTYSSTKRLYNRPTRGSQGNALQTLLALPHFFGGRIYISSVEGAYEVKPWFNEATQEGGFELKDMIEPPRKGFSIKFEGIEFDAPYNIKEDMEEVVEKFIVVNPHISFTFFDGEEQKHIERRGSIKRFKSKKEPLEWYNFEDFKALIGGFVNSGHEGLSVKRFMTSRFKGIATNSLSRRWNNASLKDLVDGNGELKELYVEGMEESTTLKATSISALNRKSFEDYFKRLGKSYLESIKHKRKEFTIRRDGREYPFVVNIAGAMHEEEGIIDILGGINCSPAHSNREFKGFIDNIVYSTPSCSKGMDVMIHLSTPYIEFTTYGKGEFQVPNEVKEWIEKELEDFIFKEWIKQAKREERQRQQNRRIRQDMDKEARKPKIYQKDMILQTLEEARMVCSEGGHEFTLRTLYYNQRSLIERRFGVYLENSNYHATIVADYEAKIGEKIALRESRGIIVHTKEDKEINIDTKYARDYNVDVFGHKHILYVEKRDYIRILKQAELHKKYDMLLVGGEGYSTHDIKKLLIELTQKSYDATVLVIHDCDTEGLEILDTLRQPHYISGREIKGEVIDVGITPEQALDQGFLSERRKVKKIPQNALNLCSEKGREFFDLTKIGKNRYEMNRVEINHFPPKKFISWVEQRLEELGLAEKLRPPSEEIHKKTEEIKTEKQELIIGNAKLDDFRLENAFYAIKESVYDREDFDRAII